MQTLPTRDGSRERGMDRICCTLVFKTSVVSTTALGAVPLAVYPALAAERDNKDVFLYQTQNAPSYAISVPNITRFNTWLAETRTDLLNTERGQLQWTDVYDFTAFLRKQEHLVLKEELYDAHPAFVLTKYALHNNNNSTTTSTTTLNTTSTSLVTTTPTAIERTEQIPLSLPFSSITPPTTQKSQFTL